MDVSVLTREGRAPPRQALMLMAASGYACAATLVGVAVALGASADTNAPLVNGLLRGALVAAPLAAAAYAFREPGFARFGRLLVLVGLVSFLSTLGESADSTLYTVGRLAGWATEALLVLLVLSFPTGRLETRVDRWLAVSTVGVVAFLVASATLVSSTFPVPSPWTSCVQDCPANGLFLMDQPIVAFKPLVVASVLLFAVLLVLVIRLQQRCDAATGLRRQMLLPLLWISMLRAALVGCGFAWRVADADSAAVEVCSWLIAVITPLVSVAFLAGLVRMRLFTENAVVDLATNASRPLDARGLQRQFAQAFADPTVEVVFPSGQGMDEWMDIDGKGVPLPADGSRRVRVIDDRGGQPVAGLLCTSTLAEHPALLDAGASIASIALENLRLQADAARALRELHLSRARLVATADLERRRLERDLHDGAQQRLVALRIELGLVEGLIRDDPERCVMRVRELEESVDAALEDLRTLAHGVRPPLLADGGLAEALPAAIAAGTMRVDLRLAGVGRYSPEIESAVYFCVLEALQNVAKHAAGATHVDLVLDGRGRSLRFFVRDDGTDAPGGPLVAGMGLTNMQDRVAAVGGRVGVRSRPGLGTTVRGEIPFTS